MNGQVVEFGVLGLANGLAVMGDEGTRSLWDHMTGACYDGAHEGAQLDAWPLRLTTVRAALKRDPDLKLISSTYRSLKMSFVKMVFKDAIHGDSMLPPGFRGTMSNTPDPRLDELRNGLGVIEGDDAKFYPMGSVKAGERVEDELGGRKLVVECDPSDGVLVATWADDGELPLQLLSRWYGFSFNYPGCAVYGEG